MELIGPKWSSNFFDLFDSLDANYHFVLEDLNKLNQLLVIWEHAFSKDDKDLGKTGLVHQINLIDDTPVKQRHHRIPHWMCNELNKHLEELLDAGVIRVSEPLGFPISIGAQER